MKTDRKTPKPRVAKVAAFGAWLRAARKRRDWTEARVVREVLKESVALEKFTRGQLSNYENGLVESPDPSVLFLLAKFYGKPVEEMLVKLYEAREQAARAKAGESPPLESPSVMAKQRTGSD